MLTEQYGTVKRMENFLKGLSNDRGQISPVPPLSYGERFVNFIKGITMSKEEAERHRVSRAMGRHSAERTASVERHMQAAEKEASKDVSQTHPRTLSTVKDPADVSGAGPASTLPIVDEAGEASSVGGQSQRSQSRQTQEPNREKDLPPVPSEEAPPTPPPNEKGKEAAH